MAYLGYLANIVIFGYDSDSGAFEEESEEKCFEVPTSTPILMSSTTIPIPTSALLRNALVFTKREDGNPKM